MTQQTQNPAGKPAPRPYFNMAQPDVGDVTAYLHNSAYGPVAVVDFGGSHRMTMHIKDPAHAVELAAAFQKAAELLAAAGPPAVTS